LFAQYGDAISELDIHRASLEDTYLALVRQAESGRGNTGTSEQEEVVR
jgi:ABC-2 type transport system ATP-binding protein